MTTPQFPLRLGELEITCNDLRPFASDHHGFFGLTVAAATNAVNDILRELNAAWDRRSDDCGETKTSIEFREVLARARKLLGEKGGA